MSQTLSVEADPREDFGKNASRRLRYAGRIPGVVYGGGGPAIPVTVDPKSISAILHSESGHNAIFSLEIKGKAPARVMLRDWQVDPLHGGLLHVDMVRVALDATPFWGQARFRCIRWSTSCSARRRRTSAAPAA